MIPPPTPWMKLVHTSGQVPTLSFQLDISESREGNAKQSKGNQNSRVDATGQPPADDHGDEQAESARRLQQTDRVNREAAHVLQERRHQHDGRDGEQSVQEDEQEADEEIALGHQARVEEGLARGQAVHHEEIETQDGESRLQEDFGRFEPVLPAAAVEHQLQGADAEGQGEKAEPVERVLPGSRLVSGTKPAMPSMRDQAEGDVDVEHVLPARVLRDVAAQRGSEERNPY